MNREIKFKAWNPIEKQFIEDVSLFNAVRLSIPNNKPETVVQFDPNSPFEYLQYTGLKDKNGVEIFEGDILGGGTHSIVIATGEKVKNSEHFSAYQVVWVDDAWGTLQVQPPRSDREAWKGLKVLAGLKTIVGNIHQHPELLEAK